MTRAMSLESHDPEEHHWWYRGHRHAVVELGRRLVPPGGVVVQVGCGMGGIIGAFPASLERYGLDPSVEAIAVARQRYPGVEFEVGGPPAVGAAAIRRASLVVVCNVLEHTYDDTGFLNDVLAGMETGASLLLTVPADRRRASDGGRVDEARRYTRRALSRTWRSLPVSPRFLAPLNRRLVPVAGVPWRPVNAALERLLVGEVPGLVTALKASPREVPGRGTGLIAVLERAPVLTWRAGPASTDGSRVERGCAAGGADLTFPAAAAAT